jgi:diguanylate cyclase (GGDEF)-like protein
MQEAGADEHTNKLLILLRHITDVRVEVKIIGIAVGISMFALLVGVIGLADMDKINRMSAQIYQKELLGVSYTKEAYINLICIARAEKNAMLAPTRKDKFRYIKIRNTNEALYLANIRDASSLLETDRERAVLSKLENAWTDYSALSNQVAYLASIEIIYKSRPSIDLAMGPARDKINAVTDALEELTRMKEQSARKLSEKAGTIYKSSRFILAGIIAGGVFLAVALGILLSFAITAPIRLAESQREAAIKMLRESEEKYRELSIVDDLTRLYNSRHFYHQIKMELDRADRYGQPLTLLLFDIDDFKRFNDTYGHIEGDQVLQRLGQVVKNCLRQTDSAYRYGGEEFTVLLPMTTSKEGIVTAERIRSEFKKETFTPVPGREVHMTVSIGLAQYESNEKIKDLIERADQFMYRGKKHGKDRVCSEIAC